MAERLTGKQKLFVEEYLVDLNASRAAVRAGYQGKWAGNCGRRNLAKPHVRAAIEAAQAPRLAALDLDARRVLAELARIAQANVFDYLRFDAAGEPVVDFRRLDREQASALSEVVVEEVKPATGAARRKVRFRLHDKLGALDKLAKHYGLYRERPGAESADGAEAGPRGTARARRRSGVERRGCQGGNLTKNPSLSYRASPQAQSCRVTPGSPITHAALFLLPDRFAPRLLERHA